MNKHTQNFKIRRIFIAMAAVMLGISVFTSCDPSMLLSGTQVIVYLDSPNNERGHVEGNGSYSRGDTITVKAIADTGYVFAHWYSGCSEGLMEQVTNLNNFANVNLENFDVEDIDSLNNLYSEDNIQNPYTFIAEESIYYFMPVFLTEEESHDIHITVIPNKEECIMGVSGTGTYNLGDHITLTANPIEGYHFIKWSDGSTDANHSITVSHKRTYVAFYKAVGGEEK